MLVVQFHVTKRAQKPAAGGARDDRPLLRMIKATGLPLHQDGFAGLAFGEWFQEGRKDLHLQRSIAGGAWRQRVLIKKEFRHRGVALCTTRVLAM